MWWPLFIAAALVVIAVAFFLIFKESLKLILGRVRWIGKGGVSVEAPQKNAPSETDTRAEAEALMRELDNALVRETEDLISRELDQRKLSAEEAVRVLKRYLAAVSIFFGFEINYRLIWGSQLSLLSYLNSQASGQPVEVIRPFYVSASTQYPAMYHNYSFIDWLEFLKSAVLVREERGVIAVTVRGREFLAHLVRMGYTLDKIG